MKAFVAILIAAVVLYFAHFLVQQYQEAQKQPAPGQSAPVQSNSAASSLAGLPPVLEAALATAQKKGASGLRNFLSAYGHLIRDPRLADIELDYVVLLSRQDPDEAKRVFAAVKARTLPNSPTYDRIKRLEKTFE